MTNIPCIYVISISYRVNKEPVTIIHQHGFIDYDSCVDYIESRDPKPVKIEDRFNEWYSPVGVFKINIIHISS